MPRQCNSSGRNAAKSSCMNSQMSYPFASLLFTIALIVLVSTVALSRPPSSKSSWLTLTWTVINSVILLIRFSSPEEKFNFNICDHNKNNRMIYNNYVIIALLTRAWLVRVRPAFISPTMLQLLQLLIGAD